MTSERGESLGCLQGKWMAKKAFKNKQDATTAVREAEREQAKRKR